MPEMSGVPRVLGTPYRFGNRTVRGVLRPPPPAGPFLDGGLTPRRMLVVSNLEPSLAGQVITDLDGYRFLAAFWTGDNLLGRQNSKTYLLFAITSQEVWSRAGFSVEPISGQRIALANANLGLIDVVKEFTRRLNDGLDIEEEIYRVICAEELAVGDYLGSLRVTRVEKALGLTYAEIA